MAQPTILACVSEELKQPFLEEPLASRAWPFALEFVNGTIGSGELIRKLIDLKSPVLLTCWGVPKLPADLHKLAPALQYICHLCGEVRAWLPRTILEKGVLLSNWGNTISRSVAECTLLQMLACLRYANHWSLEFHTRQGWGERRDEVRGLFGQKVGFHGMGAISREVIRLIAPFGCDISTYSPSVSDEDLAKLGVKRAKSLKELFSQNQIIVELAARTPANINIVTEELLMSIPKGGVFVNTGRAAVVNEAALVKVAQSGRIQIALDVYHNEPLPADSPLRGLPNVFLTPHIGGPTADRQKDSGYQALSNIEAFLAGRKNDMKSVVSLEAYDRMT